MQSIEINTFLYFGIKIRIQDINWVMLCYLLFLYNFHKAIGVFSHSKDNRKRSFINYICFVPYSILKAKECNYITYT